MLLVHSLYSQQLAEYSRTLLKIWKGGGTTGQLCEGHMLSVSTLQTKINAIVMNNSVRVSLE